MDLQVRAADADRQDLDQQVAVGAGWLDDLVEAGTTCLHRHDGDGLHATSRSARGSLDTST
jgi:hypothetical protein